MASPKFANSTVNHSQIETPRMNHDGSSLGVRNEFNHSPVVRMLPTYTVNITGLRISRRGSSFQNESTSARRMISESNKERALEDMVIAPAFAIVQRWDPTPGPARRSVHQRARRRRPAGRRTAAHELAECRR